MCTVITELAIEQPQIAKRNFAVYKMGYKTGDGFEAIYTCFEYKKDKIYETNFTYSTSSLESVADSIEMAYRQSIYHPAFVLEGFHAFSTFIRASYSLKRCTTKNIVLGKFIIPKGAKFYKNPAHCIVSNQIIFRKTI